MIKRLLERALSSLIIYIIIILVLYLTAPMLFDLAEDFTTRKELIDVLIRLLSATAS